MEPLTLIFKLNLKLLKSSFMGWCICSYSVVYIFVYIPIKRTISVSKTETAAAGSSNINQKVILKNCTTFTDCINLINYTQMDHAKKIDVAFPMQKVKECRGNYLKSSENLWY